MFKFILALLLPLTAGAQNAALTTNGTQLPGVFHQRNFTKNPGAEQNANYITQSASITTRSTSSPLQGIASFAIDGTSSGQTVKFDTQTLESLLKGQNCEARFTFSGDALLYKAYVEQGSTKVTTDLQLTFPTYSQDVSINFPCGDLSSNSHLVLETTSASAAAIKVDGVYLGLATNLSSIASTQVYSAQVSSTGVVTGENTNWISGNCSGSAPYTCTFVTGLFTTGPNCVATPQGANTTARIDSASTSTSVVVRTLNYTPGTTDSDFNIVCQKASSDAAMTAVRADQTDYDWTSYTPTTQGFGTFSPTNFCQHSRDGSDLLIRCKGTTGTTSGNQARVGLPGSLVSADTTKIPSVQNCGVWIRNTAVASVVSKPVLCDASQAYVNFGYQTASDAEMTKQDGNAIVGNTELFSFFARVPIQGWTANQNAPVLVGSVTSNASGAERIERAYVTNGGSCSISAGDQSGAWITSLSHPGTGQCTLTLASGFFSVKPACTITPVSVDRSFITAQSTSSITTYTRSGTGTDADSDFNIICVGPR